MSFGMPISWKSATSTLGQSLSSSVFREMMTKNCFKVKSPDARSRQRGGWKKSPTHFVYSKTELQLALQNQQDFLSSCTFLNITKNCKNT
jgi:hypothetical protein